MSEHNGQEPTPATTIKSASGAIRVAVLRLKVGQQVYVRLLTDEYGGCMTHYTSKQSKYCPGDDSTCSYHRIQPTWKGYAPCIAWDAKQKLWLPFVLELTCSLELDMRDRFARGQEWRIYREEVPKKKEPPYIGELIGEVDGAELPDAFEIEPVLCNMYNISSINLDVPNPMPARVFVAPIAAAEPLKISQAAAEQARKQAEYDEAAKRRREHREKADAERRDTGRR